MAKARLQESAQVASTTLGAETHFSGTLRFKDSLRIRGRFEGEIDATGRLYIDPEAEVKSVISMLLPEARRRNLSLRFHLQV